MTIPYPQLNKSPDAHTGEKVTYTGQIFQIIENPEGGGVMLLAVTDEGYGLWDDNVWVDYQGHVKGAEHDMATVWGFVAGSKSYDTQIGGNTTVPEIHAKFVEG